MKLLFDEYPIIFSPSLATLLDLKKAVLLQQIHYWIYRKELDPELNQDYFFNGHMWVKMSYKQWVEYLPYLGSIKTIQRIVESLHEKQLIEVVQVNDIDRTYWYRINYEALEAFVLQNENKLKKVREKRRLRKEIDRSRLVKPKSQNDLLEGKNDLFQEAETTSCTITKITNKYSNITKDQVDDNFDKLWELVKTLPKSRRVNKKKSREAYHTLKDDRGKKLELTQELLDQVHDSYATWVAYWLTFPEEKHKYIPWLSSWLNASRWLDEAPTPAPENKPIKIDVDEDLAWADED